MTAIAHPVEDDDGDLVWSSGIGAGYGATGEGVDTGTFALGPNTTATILSGMDTNGVEVTEVQAGDFGSLENPGWCTNCYVHIVAVCNPPAASDWAKLQQALTNDAAASLTCAAFEHAYADGTNFVKLLKDVTADTEVDTCLVIALGSRAVLDLNGMTLDRGLSALEDEGGMPSGHVISVFGELTVTDKGKANDGRITGGYGVECGGVAIGGYSKAEKTDILPRFVLEGGAIVGNKSSTKGGGGCSGGVLVDNGEFLMHGGRIAENLV